MSHKHRNVLQAIYHDPVSANIQWREVESLLHHLGAEIEPSHGARFRIVLNRREFFLHHPHHSNEFSKQEVKHLRECLASAGMTLSSYDEGKGRRHLAAYRPYVKLSIRPNGRNRLSSNFQRGAALQRAGLKGK